MKSNEVLFKSLRIALGLFLIGYALNKFLHVLPSSYGSMPEVTEEFINGVAIYLPYIYIFEIIVGLLLILNKWTPFVLIVLFPLSVAFMIFSISNGSLSMALPALFVAILNVILLLRRKEAYKPLFV